MTSLALLLALAVGGPSGLEAKFRSGESAVVGAEERVDHDVYLAGGSVQVMGRVAGDVVAAGGEVRVAGPVTEDVIAAGGRVIVEGPIGDDLRVAAGEVRIGGDVGDDVIATGGSVTLAPATTVQGDLVVSAGSAAARGTVGGNLVARAGELVIAGTVRGGADLRADRVTLEPTARIEGDLRYTSPHEAVIPAGATVVGTITRQVPTVAILGLEAESTPFTRALAAAVGRVRWMAGTLIVGLLLLWLAPAAVRSARGTLESSPWASLGMGALTLILVPIAVALAGAIAIAVAGLAGAPVGIVPLAAYLAAVALAAPVVALFLGTALLGRGSTEEPRAWRALLLGAALLAVAGLVPVLGGLVALLTILFGLGAWALLGWRVLGSRRHPAPAPA